MLLLSEQRLRLRVDLFHPQPGAAVNVSITRQTKPVVIMLESLYNAMITPPETTLADHKKGAKSCWLVKLNPTKRL